MRDCSAERANAQPGGARHLARGKTVRVFLYHFSPLFQKAKGKSAKRRDRLCLSLLFSLSKNLSLEKKCSVLQGEYEGAGDPSC